MQYTCPLTIFSEPQLSKIYNGNIKAVKQEILLLFQLEQTSTIYIGDRELDKNGVLELFNQIENNLSLHSIIHSDNALLKFLESGNLGLFESKVQLDSKMAPKEYNELVEMLAEKINKILGEQLFSNSLKSLTYIENIVAFTKTLRPSTSVKCYNKTYDLLEIHLNDIESKFESPFKNKTKTIFHSDINNLVSIKLFKSLKIFPDEFELLRRKYSIWCNNNIVSAAFERESRFDKYETKNLRILSQAAQIASIYYNKDDNFKLSRDINEFINRKYDSNSSSKYARIIFLAALFIIKILFFFSNSLDEPKGYGSQRKLKKKITKLTPSMFSDFSKGIFESPTFTDKQDYTEVTFETHYFPKDISSIYLRMPKELKKKYKGEKRQIKLTFKDIDFEDISMSYDALYDFKLSSFAYQIDTVTNYKKSITFDSIYYYNHRIDRTKNTYNLKTKQSTSFIKSYVTVGKDYIEFLDNIFELEKLNGKTIPVNNPVATQEIMNKLKLEKVHYWINMDLELNQLANPKIATLETKGDFFFGQGFIDIDKNKLFYYQEVHTSPSDNSVDFIKLNFN